MTLRFGTHAAKVREDRSRLEFGHREATKKMKYIILLVCITYAAAAAVDDCAEGQAHWCSSLKVAKRCGAIQHCIDNVWSQKAPYAQDSGDICQFCEDMVGDVRKLFGNTTEDKIAKYMDAACRLIPIKEYSDRCLDYVKNDLDAVFQLIRSTLDPGAVCSTLGLCASYQDLTQESNSLHRVALLKASQDIEVRKDDTTTTEPPAAVVCDDCKKLVADIKKFFTDKATEAQVENYFKENVCAHLGPVASECVDLVEEYIPEIMEMVTEGVDPSMVCGAFKFCPGGDRSLLARMRLSKSPLFKAASKNSGMKECDICKVILSEFQDLDRNQILQSDLESVIKDKLCPLLGSLKSECELTVDNYGQFLFEFLANELDPATRCESLGFCVPSNTVRRPSATRAATPVQRPAAPVHKLKQSASCILCEFIMSELDNMLSDNATQAEIEQALEKVCSYLPDTISQECNDFVKEYAEAIIDLLSQELNPAEVCSTLGLCTSSLRLKQLIMKTNKVLTTTEQCGVCETIIQYMDSLLEEKSTEDDIEKLVEKICNFMPENLSNECNNFVKQYGPQIIHMVTQIANPEQVCTELGLCQKSKIRPMQKLQPAILTPRKGKLVGVSKCTYGPSYWCASRDNAKECNAVAHCEQHVWAKPIKVY